MRQFAVKKGGVASAESPEAKKAFKFGIDNSFRVSYEPANVGKYKIYLFGYIEDAGQFIDALDALGNAGPHDLVEIYLSTGGGSLDAADTFIHGMQTCQARIRVIASGGVHSAGTLILLNADEFVLSGNFNALIHNGSCGPAGKFSDWEAEATHTKKYMRNVFETNYKHFLSDDELDALVRGTDFWMDGTEFLARWENRQEALEAEETDEDYDDEDEGFEVPADIAERVKEAFAEVTAED